MLTIGKLAPGQADYYLKAVGQGIEDYYSGDGEAPGWWTGAAADELNIFGQVDGELLHRALTGQHPASGDALSATAPKVPGFDLTFSAPKSVSLLFALGDLKLGAQVRDAHEAAVAAALGYMERQAAVGRRGRGGHTAVLGNGFLAAAFRHRSSRAGDPQLHTHVLVANTTRGPDGRWTALDARRLYVNAKTGGYLYQAHLRSELTHRIGVQFEPVHRGQAEITGLPADILKAFSRRRAEVQAELAARGEHTSRAAQVATLATRHAKDYDVDPGSLREGWWQRAADLGLSPTDLTDALHCTQPKELDSTEVAAVVDQLAGPAGLTQRRSSFTRRDVLQAWAQRLPDGADVTTVEDLADAFMASEHAVPLAAGVAGLTVGDVVRRADGRIIPARIDERPHSTPELLATEQQLIDHALAAADADRGTVPEATARRALNARPSLSDEQAAMVTRLTTGGEGVQVVVGPAGTGKTYALDAAREAWQDGGHTVVGVALARRAARELQDGAGIPSTSVAALLADLRELGPTAVLGEHGVLVVDEAGMVGTRHLAELLAHADQARAKVVLVGDPRQLPEIDAGGALRALIARTDPIVLTTNRRQSAAWERDALELLRRGRTAEALERYRHHDRVVLGDDAPTVRGRLVADWWHARQGGTDAVMIAARRGDVAELNALGRTMLAVDGRLGDQVLEIAGRPFAAGDEIVTLRNAPRLGVLNGTRATVIAVDPDARELTVRTTDGQDLTLPATYVDGRDDRDWPLVDHRYAITGHKAQGMTADAAFVLGSDELYREWGYVALSRGRDDNRLYVVAGQPRDRDELAPGEPARDPLGEVTRNLRRSRAQTFGLDAAAAAELAAAPTDHLVEQERQLRTENRDLGTGDRPAAAGADRERDALTRQLQAAQHAARDAPNNAARAQATSQVDRLTTRLQTIDDRAVQAARPPADPQRDAHRQAITAELDARIATRVQAALASPPAYLTSALDPVPDRLTDRDAWRAAAIRIEAFRVRAGVRDPDRALGPEPRDLADRATWRELRREIEHSRDALQRGSVAQRAADRGIGRPDVE